MTNSLLPSPNSDLGSFAYVSLISLVIAVGGLLFGFDTVVIAGAIGFREEQFQLDPTQKGFIASCVFPRSKNSRMNTNWYLPPIRLNISELVIPGRAIKRDLDS